MRSSPIWLGKAPISLKTRRNPRKLNGLDPPPSVLCPPNQSLGNIPGFKRSQLMVVVHVVASETAGTAVGALRLTGENGVCSS
ncbi:hypothetical protein ACFXTO_024642 [Malus domestica]